MMLLDAVVGMTILGLLLGALATSVVRHNAALHSLQTQRRLDRLAESVLSDLQQGNTPTIEPWDQQTQPSYTIDRLDTPAPRPGWAWVRVTAEYEHKSAELVGAAPQVALTSREETP